MGAFQVRTWGTSGHPEAAMGKGRGVEHCGYKAEKLAFHVSECSFFPREASSLLMLHFNLPILGNSSF